jgi:hypothetical protein
MYEINDKRESRPVAMYSHDGPVLDLAWSKVSYFPQQVSMKTLTSPGRAVPLLCGR